MLIIKKICLLVGVLTFSAWVHAVPINNSEITASSTMAPVTIGGGVGTLALEEILDGIVSDAFPYNGFATNNSAGTIRFDFANAYDLESFTLWNDINVQAQGVKDFYLEFFDSNNNQILPGFSTNYVGAFNQVAGEVYAFASMVSNVSWVNMVVTSSYPSFNRIEIREVAFDGVLASVDAPASLLLMTVLVGLIRVRR